MLSTLYFTRLTCLLSFTGGWAATRFAICFDCWLTWIVLVAGRLWLG